MKEMQDRSTVKFGDNIPHRSIEKMKDPEGLLKSDSLLMKNNEEGEEESQSTPVADPENYAIRNMQFRERRGTKMNYLINRKK